MSTENPTSAVDPVAAPVRRKLPDERRAITHKFDISGHEGYITVGLYEDGMPGEIFLILAREGTTLSGFADAFAHAISLTLQYGVPLELLVDRFSHTRFEPSGITKNPELRFAKSIVDYVFRWLAQKFLAAPQRLTLVEETPLRQIGVSEDCPPCSTCGSIMVRRGLCYKCTNCGATSGCV